MAVRQDCDKKCDQQKNATDEKTRPTAYIQHPI